jgi:hypothetical protein
MHGTYLEIINDGFAVEIIVCDSKKVPIQGLTPWVSGTLKELCDLPVDE